MYSGFCVLEGFLSVVKKGIFRSALIKKRCYWPKGVPLEEIIRKMQNKEVGDVEAVQFSIRLNRYHIMAIKEPKYMMLMTTTYGTLDNLEVLDTQRRYKAAGGELVTKQFNYLGVFGYHFNYIHKVDDNNNRHHYPISV